MKKPQSQKPSKLGASLEKKRRSPKKGRPSSSVVNKAAHDEHVADQAESIDYPYQKRGNIGFAADIFSHPNLEENAEARKLLEALVGGVNPADDHHGAQLGMTEHLANGFLMRVTHWLAAGMEPCSVAIQVPQACVDADDASFSMKYVGIFRRGIRSISHNAAWQMVPTLRRIEGQLRVVYMLRGFAFEPSLHETIDARVRELSIRLNSAEFPGAIRVIKLETPQAQRRAVDAMFCVMLHDLPKQADAAKRSHYAMRLLQIRSLIEVKQLTALDTGEGREVMRAALAKAREHLPERKLALLSGAPKARRGRDIAMLQRVTGFQEAQLPYLQR